MYKTQMEMFKVCATSKGSDQPAHQSLESISTFFRVRAFASRLTIEPLREISNNVATIKGSDQPAHGVLEILDIYGG